MELGLGMSSGVRLHLDGPMAFPRMRIKTSRVSPRVSHVARSGKVDGGLPARSDTPDRHQLTMFSI
jgi:hypothetical protein